MNITIRVTDVDNEAPDTPFAPTVTAVSSTSLQVTWEAPANTGPPITDYDYRYREPSGILDGGHEHDDHRDGGDDRGTGGEHLLRRRGAGDERRGHQRLVEPGHRDDERARGQQPARLRGGVRAPTRSVSAGAQPETSIGDPVEATDADSDDTLTYSLEGRDAALFDIGETNGQLLTRSGVTLIAGRRTR